ncbi:alpha-ketoglutarate-dependent dioxygenase AlkB [Lysobacter sp. GX 14042]|uniref:alpha-ketoglutarate-dependent dioxygenase AlkB n=1 Tax=Lysobacter sp. GX 14042 TaxID=2907155 RepID=UPI001F456D03|nr:alpha-ketoglutarate-dependent dioxygenase AlkB [Lysobacter sp. GX 14042]MCE7031552.1 alpha-ketoglutarate-dependent dioxygenase AlkB [Lysobacter sp. GX 14042]
MFDDPGGGVRYRPGVVDPATAEAWFDALRDGIAWKSQRRLMYERVVEVPRLVASWWLADPGLPAALGAAFTAVREVVDEPFNAVGLNFYRDGDDSVAPHGDKLHMLVPGHPVVLLSLGAARRMSIRPNTPPRRSLQVELEPGSVLLMSYRSQLTHQHGVPKTRQAVGPRISLAFRVRPQADA